MIVLGVDTAIRCTGYGIIEMSSVNGKLKVLDCGVIKNKSTMPHSECLRRIAGGIRQLIAEFKPSALSIEDAFFAKNVKTSMILSMARGAVITVSAEASIPVYVYSPKTAKRGVTGSGNSSKEQVASMISAMSGISIAEIPLDSTDALALALSHIQIALRPELQYLMPNPI